ncbi:retrovirus-related pol polyprotein from transposon TNT 1-94 [Tanacetum coccineum]
MRQQCASNAPSFVKSDFLVHFLNRFAKPDPSRIRIDFLFPNHLPSAQDEEMERSVSYDEIKQVVWDCATNKSPGLDDFSFEFFCKYWNIVDHDVVGKVNAFFVSGSFSRGCNSSFIALIPKKQDVKVVDFRPISLIGSIYKIVSRILVNRLSFVIVDIISKVQLDFVSNRKILDGPFILNELISWCERNVVSWNVLMTGNLDGGSLGNVLKLFREMVGEGGKGNDTTVVSVVIACGRSCRLKEGRETVFNERFKILLAIDGFFKIPKDFQENYDDEVGVRIDEEYLRDLDIEFHESALLSSQQVQSGKNEPKISKDYKTEYKKMKAKLALLEAGSSKVSDDEEITQVKVLMALADDELAVGKNHAMNREWIDITMRKVNIILSLDEDSEWQNYVKYISIDLKFFEEQRLNLLSKYNKLVFELNKCRDDLLVFKQAKLEAINFQLQNTELIKQNHALQEQLKEEKHVNEKWLNSSNKVERHNPGSKLPNFNTRRILVLESQAVNECLKLIEAPIDPKSSKESRSAIDLLISHSKGETCTCESNVHSTTDYNHFEHFKRGERIQATKAKEPTKRPITKSVPKVKLIKSSSSRIKFTDTFIDITPPEQSNPEEHYEDSSFTTPKDNIGKGIARDTDESLCKLVLESKEVRPDPDTPAHIEKEERMERAAQEAKLMALSKPDLIKVVEKVARSEFARDQENRKQYRVFPGRYVPTRLEMDYRRTIDDWCLTDIHIHLNTKQVAIIVYRNNDQRNFDVHNPVRRIQVKDIVKEVADYLKTYSSARMDISWYHFIRDHILKGDIELTFFSHELAMAWLFYKNPLAEPSFTRLVAELANDSIFFDLGPEFDIGNIIFSDLVTKLQYGKKGREPNVFYTRFLSLLIEKLLGENYNNDDLTLLKPYTISTASFKKPLAYKVALTSHMLKVAKFLNESKQSLILPSEEIQKPIDEEIVNESDLKSLGNVSFDDLSLGANESPYDTKSEIKDMTVTNSDLESMPEDEIKSVSRFEAAKSDVEENDKPKTKAELSKSEEVTADNVLDELANMAINMNASAEKPSISEPLVQVPETILKLLNKEFHALNTLDKNKIDGLQTTLTNAIKTRASKSSQSRVKKGIKGVRGLFKYCITQLDKNDVNLRELVDLIRDLVILLDSATTSTTAAPEGEKMST